MPSAHLQPAPLLFMGLIGLNSHNAEEARLVQHLAQRGHPIVYLAPLGVRDPAPRQWLEGLRRLRRATGPRAPTRAIRSAALMVLPWRWWTPVTRLNLRLVRWQVARATRGLADRRPVLWLRLPTPELVEQLARLDVDAVVYECIDDYSAYPHYQSVDVRRLERSERKLVARADLVITLSDAVAARFPQAHERTRVVPLGADLACFRQSPLEPPADVTVLPGPRLGLLGGLDERVDFELLRMVGLAEPSWSIVLVGPTLDRVGLRRVTDLPNVYVLGPRPHRCVPAYLNALDVCLIPYRRTQWTAGCFPAKLMDYLASGRPVVATALPGLATYADVIELTADPQAFISACRRAISERSQAAAGRRQAVAAAASLDGRCDALDALLAALPAR